MKNYLTNEPVDLIQLTPKISVLPVIHGSVESTILVRRLFLENPPKSLVLPLPYLAKDNIYTFLNSFQDINVSVSDEKSPNYVIAEPLQPVIEAFRSATEANIPVYCIRWAQRSYPFIEPQLPDTYSLHYYPLIDLFNRYEKDHKAELQSAITENTNPYEALHFYSTITTLEQIGQAAAGPILFVCGFDELVTIKSWLALHDADQRKQLEQAKEIIQNDRLDTKTMFERVQLKSAIEFFFNSPHEPLDYLTKFRAQDYFQIIYLMNQPTRFEGSARENKKQLHDTTIEPDEPIHWAFSLSEKSGEVLAQPFFYNKQWLLARKSHKEVLGFSRLRLQRAAYRESRHTYERETAELIAPQIEKLFFRFTRNWAILKKQLLPDSYMLVMAAKAFINDNFARIFYDVLIKIETTDTKPLTKIDLTLTDLNIDSKLIRFREKLKQSPQMTPASIRKGFRREKFPGEWASATGGGMCSYPPEDITIENFASQLQNKTLSLIKSNEVRTLPFSSSLLDGINYRETIRNITTNQIIVNEVRRLGADVGNVVVIYSDDEVTHSWQTVWWGEHNQESDMAFYATPLHNHFVGPGISRCIYGGFLLSYPPGRLGDIWSDPFFRQFATAGERLLAAAILYNVKSTVVHVSDKPPAARLRSIAGRFGQRIVHFPLSNINPVELGRVRRFHVLEGRDKRDIADDYIW